MFKNNTEIKKELLIYINSRNSATYKTIVINRLTYFKELISTINDFDNIETITLRLLGGLNGSGGGFNGGFGMGTMGMGNQRSYTYKKFYELFESTGSLDLTEADIKIKGTNIETFLYNILKIHENDFNDINIIKDKLWIYYNFLIFVEKNYYDKSLLTEQNIV